MYYSVRKRVPNIYKSLAKLIAVIIYAKTFNFKVVSSRIGDGNIKDCEPVIITLCFQSLIP